MLPRGKLLALIAFVVAAAMITSTGAFSSVEAKRSVEMKVTGDKNAYLGLEAPANNSSNGVFTTPDDNGKMVLKFNSETKTAGGGTGLNPDAVTTFDNVFVIRNQGTENVKVFIEENNPDVTYYDSDTGTTLNSGNAVEITPGKAVYVGIKVNTKGMGSGDTIGHKIVIHANSPNAAKPNPGGFNASGDTTTPNEKKTRLRAPATAYPSTDALR